MAMPAPDIAHPLYRAAIHPFATGARDVLGAMLLTGELELGPAQSERLTAPAVVARIGPAAVAYAFQCTGALDVAGVIVLSGSALPVLAGSLMGEGPLPDGIGDMHIPMLRDTLSNVLGRWATSLSEERGTGRLDVRMLDAGSPLEASAILATFAATEFALESYPLQFEGQPGNLMLALPPEALAQIISTHPAYQPPEAVVADHPFQSTPESASGATAAPIPVSRPQFQQLDDRDRPTSAPRHLDLLRDVPLTITVELGKRELTIKDILELSPGALVELDRLAGEPLDLLINGQLFAKGEVVVIDESFGMRITSIVSPEERLQSLR